MPQQNDVRKIWLLAAARTNPATAATLNGASAYKTRGLDYKAYEGDKKELQYDGDAGQDVPVRIQNAYNSFNFKLDAAPSGTLGTVPFADIFLRVCGAVSSKDETTDEITYTAAESQNDIAYLDAVVSHRAQGNQDYVIKSNGMRGSIGLSLKSGEDPEFDVQLMGDYVRPIPAAHAAAEYGLQNTNLAVPVNASNTLLFKVNNKSICVQEFMIKNLFGYTPSRRDLAGGCRYTGMKKGIVEADITFLEPDWDLEFNPYALAETDAGINRAPFALEHGTESGKMFAISATETQLIGVEKAEIDGDVARKATIRFLVPLNLIWK